MSVYRDNIEFSTGGHADTRDLTGAAEEILRNSELDQGIMVLFCSSSTSGLTTIEYESGALSDLKRVFDEIAPQDREYRHNLRWGDGNGHSHVRAALLGPSLAVPFSRGRLDLGTWQQIIHIDFDNRPRRRSVLVQLVGE